MPRRTRPKPSNHAPFASAKDHEQRCNRQQSEKRKAKSLWQEVVDCEAKKGKHRNLAEGAALNLKLPEDQQYGAELQRDGAEAHKIANLQTCRA